MGYGALAAVGAVPAVAARGHVEAALAAAEDHLLRMRTRTRTTTAAAAAAAAEEEEEEESAEPAPHHQGLSP